MATTTQAGLPPRFDDIKIHDVAWKHMTIAGVGLIILGMLAIAMPVFSGVISTLALGGILCVAAVVQAIHAIREKDRPGRWSTVILAMFALAAGIGFLAFPVAGLVALTWLVICYFFIEGLYKFFFSFQLKPMKGWGWVLTSGIVSVALGVFLLAQMPLSAFYTLGIVIGVNLLSHGIAECFFAQTWHKVLESRTGGLAR